LIANATGCSSIYGGNLPTTPWAVNAEGRGPAWSNSLFEDNAEFGLGFRLTLDKQAEYAHELLGRLRRDLGDDLVDGLLDADQTTPTGIYEQRGRVSELKRRLAGFQAGDTSSGSADGADGRERQRCAADLASLADVLLRRSV
jgi:pyruvate-ferredoxin/flavodoxin oxidoreductase